MHYESVPVASGAARVRTKLGPDPGLGQIFRARARDRGRKFGPGPGQNYVTVEYDLRHLTNHNGIMNMICEMLNIIFVKFDKSERP